MRITDTQEMGSLMSFSWDEDDMFMILPKRMLKDSWGNTRGRRDLQDLIRRIIDNNWVPDPRESYVRRVTDQAIKAYERFQALPGVSDHEWLDCYLENADWS